MRWGLVTQQGTDGVAAKSNYADVVGLAADPDLLAAGRPSLLSWAMQRMMFVVLTLTVVSPQAAAAPPAASDEPGLSKPAALTATTQPRAAQNPSLVDAAQKSLADAPPPKSPATALSLSLGITLGTLAASIPMVVVGLHRNSGTTFALGLLLGGLGVAIGPSAGHFYAGDNGHGLRMSLVRGAVVGGSVGLHLLALVAAFGESEGAAWALLVSGIAAGLTGLGLAAWDIATAPAAARRANERLRKGIVGLRVGPFVSAPVAGDYGYGVALSGRFF